MELILEELKDFNEMITSDVALTANEEVKEVLLNVADDLTDIISRYD